MSRPFFHFDGSHRRAIHTKPYAWAYDTLLDSPTSHAPLRALLPQHVNVLTELCEFSGVIEQPLLTPEARLGPKELIEATFSIQYQLLSSAPLEDISDGTFVYENDELDKAFRLGAIIYMKEILQEFTFSATGSRILVSKLGKSLNLVFTNGITPVSSSPLLWLLFMGGVASIKNGMDRTLFVRHLMRLRYDLGIHEWEEVKERLQNVLWIGKVLDKTGKALWEETQFTNTVLGR